MPESNSRKRKPRGSLSKQAILDAAKQLLHNEGIEALSIRKIANQLGAGTMSIYNHYPNKQDIVFDLVSDFVKRAHQSAPLEKEWRTWLKHTFLNIYQASISEPEYLTLMLGSNNIGTASLDIFEDSLACLLASGFSPKQAAIAFHQLLSFCLGAAMLQVNLTRFQQESTGSPNPGLNEQSHPNCATHWQQAHGVMLGQHFDESLEAQIQSLKPA